MSEKFPRGRGSSENPANRFERLVLEPDPDPAARLAADDPEAQDPDFRDGHSNPATEFLRVTSRTAITRNDSPDLPFDFSINPYMGCEHGCAYCYARTYHEFWGFSAGLDFETKILVKEDVPDLLRKELSSPKWKPAVINLSGITDPYQPVERRLKLTRQCLEILIEFRNPFSIITKNRLVTRDLDLLARAAELGICSVLLSVTTLDPVLGGVLEPRASRPAARLDAIRILSEAGIPVGVNAAPLIPGLTDRELPSIIESAAQAGASFAGYSITRLPGAVETVFTQWLDRYAPGHRDKVLRRIRECHGGTANSSEFGNRFRGTGPHAEMIRGLFLSALQKAGLPNIRPVLRTDQFCNPLGKQLDFLD
jgi:DNA repair photolyase